MPTSYYYVSTAWVLDCVINLDGQGYPGSQNHPAFGKIEATVAKACEVSKLDALGFSSPD